MLFAFDNIGDISLPIEEDGFHRHMFKRRARLNFCESNLAFVANHVVIGEHDDLIDILAASFDFLNSGQDRWCEWIEHILISRIVDKNKCSWLGHTWAQKATTMIMNGKIHRQSEDERLVFIRSQLGKYLKEYVEDHKYASPGLSPDQVKSNIIQIVDEVDSEFHKGTLFKKNYLDFLSYMDIDISSSKKELYLHTGGWNEPWLIKHRHNTEPGIFLNDESQEFYVRFADSEDYMQVIYLGNLLDIFERHRFKNKRSRLMTPLWSLAEKVFGETKANYNSDNVVSRFYQKHPNTLGKVLNYKFVYENSKVYVVNITDNTKKLARSRDPRFLWLLTLERICGLDLFEDAVIVLLPKYDTIMGDYLKEEISDLFVELLGEYNIHIYGSIQDAQPFSMPNLLCDKANEEKCAKDGTIWTVEELVSEDNMEE